jgi:aspartyl-tRNA synthetase
MRSHYNGDLLNVSEGDQVTVAGWVHRTRDLGGLIFLQIRDRSGIVQAVIEPEKAELFAKAETLRSEFVVSATGVIRNRPADMINKASHHST